MLPGANSNGSPRAATGNAAAARCASLNPSRAVRPAARRSLFETGTGVTDIAPHVQRPRVDAFLAQALSGSSLRKQGPIIPGLRSEKGLRSSAETRVLAVGSLLSQGRLVETPAGRGEVRAVWSNKKIKCEAAMAVGALDPGVPYESRWAPCDQVHGPGQGQFPEGSIRPRGYMAPDARHSFAQPM